MSILVLFAVLLYAKSVLGRSLENDVWELQKECAQLEVLGIKDDEGNLATEILQKCIVQLNNKKYEQLEALMVKGVLPDDVYSKEDALSVKRKVELQKVPTPSPKDVSPEVELASKVQECERLGEYVRKINSDVRKKIPEEKYFQCTIELKELGKKCSQNKLNDSPDFRQFNPVERSNFLEAPWTAPNSETIRPATIVEEEPLITMVRKKRETKQQATKVKAKTKKDDNAAIPPLPESDPSFKDMIELDIRGTNRPQTRFQNGLRYIKVFKSWLGMKWRRLWRKKSAPK